jgi:tyrosinase
LRKSLVSWLLVALAAGAVPAVASAQDAAAAAAACDTGRVRKDVKDLTTDEKQRLVGAMHAMKATVSPYDSRYTHYDQFVRWHQMAVVTSKEAGGVGIAHHNPSFPPWHRKLLWLFEDGLCAASGDSSLALPYWDWTDPESTAATFALDFLGPGGKREDGYAVTEGPFNRDIWQLNILPFDPGNLAKTPQKYLVRALGIDTASPYQIKLPTIVDVNKTLGVATYDTNPWGVNSDSSFRNTLEGFVIDKATGLMDPNKQTMHNIVHDWVGGIFYLPTGTGELIPHQGTMEPLDVSPNDPAFFIHHANVDRVWASWQADHPGPDNYLPQGGEPACPFPEEDDPGPEVAFPHISDLEHMLMTAHHLEETPWPGMRLDDHLYPFCLDRYSGTLAHIDPSPADHLDTAQLGFTYEELYAIPMAD